jgi:hydrogenase 3 maturation protease
VALPQLQTSLAKALSSAERVAVLGVGSELRGDDFAGVLVARELKEIAERKGGGKLMAVIGASAPENVTGEIARFKPSHLVLVDAANLGLEPGEVRLIPAEGIGGTSFSTHMLPVRILLDYLEKTTGCQSLVVGIQPEHTRMCGEPSAAVTKAVAGVVATFEQVLGL